MREGLLAGWTRTDVTTQKGLFCGILGAVPKRTPTDYIDFDAGREGYVNSPSKFVPVVAIPKVGKLTPEQRSLRNIRWEERLASLVAAGGTIWAVYVATQDLANLWRLQISPPGPLEVCALGILLWLHAKYRRSTKVL